MEEILKNYNVNNIEELKMLIENDDETIQDLIEFLDYYNDKQSEKYN